MDGMNRIVATGARRVTRSFDPNRLARQTIAAAYERLVPPVRVRVNQRTCSSSNVLAQRRVAS